MPLIGTFGAGSAGGYGQRKGAAFPFNAEYLVIGGGGAGGFKLEAQLEQAAIELTMDKLQVEIVPQNQH